MQASGFESTNDLEGNKTVNFLSGGKWISPFEKLKVLCKFFKGFTLLVFFFFFFFTISVLVSEALLKAARRLTRVVVDVSFK